MEVTEKSEESPLLCSGCNSIVKNDDIFCGNCGMDFREVGDNTIDQEDVFTVLKPTLLYYSITLILLIVYKFTTFFPEGFEGLFAVSVIDILIVLIFWADNIRELKPLFSLSSLKLRIVSLTIIGALLGSYIVSVLAEIINLSINDDVFYDTYLFYDTSYPFLLATLFIAVQPAIFEEVAFRGFLFNNLKKVTSPTSCIYVTGFIFGIMHLTFVSLLWLVPIGLAFAFLRVKYNTLWYGIIGHFFYNFFIVAYEFMGWF